MLRDFKRNGITAFKAQKKPELSKNKMKERLRMATEYIKHPDDFLYNVIFSVEATFSLKTSNYGNFVFRKRGTELNKKT